jgi:cbb3-type cytochrome oxidase maturation protein
MLMDEATIGLTVMTVFIGLVFLGFLIWGIKSGQFHNVEEAKYHVFRKQKPTDDENKSEEASREVKPDAGP